MAQETAANKKKSKSRRKVKQGIVNIQSSYNNTLISVSDMQGNVLAWSSAGRVGFAGARKATPFAGTQVMNNVIEQLKPFGLEEVKILVKGIGSAREAAIRALSSSGLQIISLRDVTPIPHNGVRPPKRRRI
jgi:small subunit ribosomal protein S11